MSLLALIVITITASAVTCVEMDSAVLLLKENYKALAFAPVIVSAKITPELIEQMKVKYGRIKLITVVVEAPVYDIDQLSAIEISTMKLLGIDVAQVRNKSLELSERLKPFEKLYEYRDESDKREYAQSLLHIEGKIIEEGEQYQFLVKRPDRGLIKMLLPLAQGGKIDEFAEKAVKNLIVEGDIDALEDGIVFMGVVSQLKEMIAPAQAFLSKA